MECRSARTGTGFLSPAAAWTDLGCCAEWGIRHRDRQTRCASSYPWNLKKHNKQTNQSWSITRPAPRNVGSSPQSPSQPARSRPGDTLCGLQGWPAGIVRVPTHMPPSVTTLLRGVPDPTAPSVCFCHTCPRRKPSRSVCVLGWEPGLAPPCVRPSARKQLGKHWSVEWTTEWPFPGTLPYASASGG